MSEQGRKRRKSWHKEVWLGRDSDGKPIRVSVTRPTKREMEEEVARLKAEYAQGTFIRPSRITVGEYLKDWLNDYEFKAETTRESYTMIVNQYLIPYLGNVQLQKLGPLHIRRYYADRRREGKDLGGIQGRALSGTTLLYHHRVLSRALKQARDWGLVANNVAQRVDAPRKEEYRPTVWTLEDGLRFLGSIEGHRLYALYYTALLTGLRRGELFGLKWADIDWDNRRMVVRRSLVVHQDEHGTWRPQLRDGLKTAGSVRSIACSPALIQALSQHRMRQEKEREGLGELYGDLGLVFCQMTGAPYYMDNVTYRQFRSLQKKAGVPLIRFHDLRHTHASWMLATGEHPKVLQHRLGHSSITMTMDIYSHLLPGMDTPGVERLDSMLDRSKNVLSKKHEKND